MCKPSHVEQTEGGRGGGQCSQRWGRWRSDDPPCKTAAAKFAKCLESRSVSYLSLAQTNPKQAACAHVEHRSRPPLPCCKHASIFPVPPPPVLTRRTFMSVLHHFLFDSVLQADRRGGTTPPGRCKHHTFPRLPCSARAGLGLELR